MGIAGDPAPVSAVMDMVAKGAGADKASVRAAEADFDEAAQGEPFTPDFPVPASPACADSPPAATPDS